jgi:hypothetical protein
MRERLVSTLRGEVYGRMTVPTTIEKYGAAKVRLRA